MIVQPSFLPYQSCKGKGCWFPSLPASQKPEVIQHTLVITGSGTEHDGTADLMVTDGALRRPRSCLLTGHKPLQKEDCYPPLPLDSLQTPPPPSPDPDVRSKWGAVEVEIVTASQDLNNGWIFNHQCRNRSKSFRISQARRQSWEITLPSRLAWWPAPSWSLGSNVTICGCEDGSGGGGGSPD